jgi:large subunit ribosomal protein L9
MKIVLKETVEKVGATGDIVEVAPGFARNYLLPKGLALLANPANLKTVEMRRKREDVKRTKMRGEAETLAHRITALSLDLAHRAGETDTIYGAVTASEIAYALEEKGVPIDHRRILLERPIKTLGTFQVPIRLHPDVTAHVTVNVVREEV